MCIRDSSKPGAIAPPLHRFTGKARCFNSEEEAETAILGGVIRKGEVVVIRYEGPKGGPGMREMFKAMKYIYGMGLAMDTALITDGRFSGTNNGCFVGHISPEAAEGGPLALVEDGDEIPVSYTHLLSGENTERDQYSLIMANPPFTGSVFQEEISKDLLALCKTRKTELLFVALFTKMLKVGGRCACIVPDGVLFGSSKAHQAIRRELVERMSGSMT